MERRNCAASVSFQLSERRQWLAQKKREKEVSTLSSWIYQHMTLLCLEHTLYCSGGKHGSFDNIPGKSRDKQGGKAQAGCRHVSTLDLCGAASHESGATFFFFFFLFFHIKIPDPTCVSTFQPLLQGGKKEKKNILKMKCTALTSGGRLADTFDRSPPPRPLPPPSCEKRQMRSKDSHSCSRDMAR